MPRSLWFVIFLLGGFLANAQEFETYNKEFLQLYKQKKYNEAREYALKAREAAIHEYGDTSRVYTTTLYNMALLYEDMGDVEGAKTLYKESIAIIKKAHGSEDPDYCGSMSNLAILYYTQANYTDAETINKEVLYIRERTLGEQHPLYANTLNNLALLYVRTGKYAEADYLYKKALAIRKLQGEETLPYAQSLNNLGFLYYTMGNYGSAESLYRQALSVRKKISGEQNYDYGNTLNKLGLLYYTTGNYSAAEPLFRQTLDIYKKGFGDTHPEYAGVLNNLANLYYSRGSYAEAKYLYQQVLTIYQATVGKQYPEYASVLENIAVLDVATEHYPEAVSLLKEVLLIRAAGLGKKHPDYARSLSNLAAVYIKMGKYDSVIMLTQQSLAIRKELLGEEHPQYAQGLINLAAAYILKGDFSEVENLYKQALTLRKRIMGADHPDVAKVFKDLGMLYMIKGQYALVETNLLSATDIFFAHIKNNFGNLNEAEKLKWWENESAHFESAPSLLVSNSFPSAAFLQQACTQQLRLKGFVLDDGARVLREVRRSSDSSLKKLATDWQNNKSIVATQYSLPLLKRMPGLDSLEGLTAFMEKQITQQSSLFRISRQNLDIGFREVQRALKNEECAIEFVRFNYVYPGVQDSVLYAAFIISSFDTIPHFVVICGEKQLAAILNAKNKSSEQLVTQLYRGGKLSQQTVNRNDIADSLYKLLWKPLLPWLKTSRKIYIAPAGLLCRVSFQALQMDSATRLIDKYELRIYSSTRQIAEEQIPVNKKQNNAITLYGGIEFNESRSMGDNKAVDTKESFPDEVKRNFSGSDWNALPGTMQEVNAIKQLFNSKNKTARLLTGPEASEEVLKTFSGQSPSILHFATHGFFLPDPLTTGAGSFEEGVNPLTLAANPLLRSGIILAGANRVWGGAEPLAGKEDGIVTAYEISNLDLSNTDLVVLSACETALGDIRGTEGVFGLQRAFKLAGVKKMILSLWQVPDKETAELMQLFYSNVLKGGPVYQAFYEAQRAMRKKYPPYYWAAFILIE